MFKEDKEQTVNLQKELLELKSQLFELKLKLINFELILELIHKDHKDICKYFNIDNNYILIQTGDKDV